MSDARTQGATASDSRLFRGGPHAASPAFRGPLRQKRETSGTVFAPSFMFTFLH